MVKKMVIRVTYNEELQNESYYFMKRLIEKALLDELQLDPLTKGMLVNESMSILEERE